MEKNVVPFAVEQLHVSRSFFAETWTDKYMENLTDKNR